MKENAHGDGDGDGWTADQDSRLHRAHLAVRATPNFWRDIANLVPGKTAEECFHRFYSAHPTPPVAPQHARRVDCLASPIRPLEEKKKKKILSPTRLLHQSQAAKAIRGKNHKAVVKSHKAVREILRRQQIDNHGYEEDAFAALESVDVPNWDKAATSVSVITPASQKRKKAKDKDVGKDISGSISSRVSEVLRLPTLADGKKHEKYLDMLIRRNKLPGSQRRKIGSTKKEFHNSSGGGDGFGLKLKERLESSKSLATARSAVMASARGVLEQMPRKRSSMVEEEPKSSDSESPPDECELDEE